MPPKLTKEIIQKRIYNENYICTGYDVKTKKFSYICPKGCVGATRMDHWNRGVRCPCIAGNKKLKFSFIKNYFKSFNYTLLNNTYKSGKHYLDYKCPKGHEGKMRWNNFRTGHRCPECAKEKFKGEGNPYISSGAKERYIKEEHYNWKGGVSKLGLPLYDTYSTVLEKYYEIKKETVEGLTLVSLACTYCGTFYVPTIRGIVNRLQIINGTTTKHGESNFYCSGGCKKACPTYGQKKYPKGFKKATSREVQPALRKLVLKRDNYKCQICDAAIEDTELHCHHLEGIYQNPIESADVDNCIILCKKHHKQVHKLPGCGYNELKCN